MQVPTELTFHGIDHSDSAEAAVERWVARLEHLHARLTKCEVVIDQPHRKHRHREFHVRVLLEATGIELASSAERDDIYIAIADAFRAAHRQLRSKIDIQQQLAS
jgi:putative sigma-54 modulation protein